MGALFASYELTKRLLLRLLAGGHHGGSAASAHGVPAHGAELEPLPGWTAEECAQASPALAAAGACRARGAAPDAAAGGEAAGGSAAQAAEEAEVWVAPSAVAAVLGAGGAAGSVRACAAHSRASSLPAALLILPVCRPCALLCWRGSCVLASSMRWGARPLTLAFCCSCSRATPIRSDPIRSDPILPRLSHAQLVRLFHCRQSTYAYDCCDSTTATRFSRPHM